MSSDRGRRAPDLVFALVQLDRDYTSTQQTDRWEDWYAARLGDLLA